MRSCSAGLVPSSAARSTSRHSTRARSTWRRNWWPRPLPSLAPSMRPGMSATTNSRGVVEADDAEVRLERRERVVGDLRLGRRDDADQRALADVGEADEGDVGHQLHLQLQPALLAVLALLGEVRGPAPVVEELGVAPPAAPAGGGQPAVAVVQQLGEHLAGVQVGDDGALGHGDLQRLAALAVEVLALAVDAVAGAAVGVVAERQQRGHVVVGDEPDVAALAAVAAVRSAEGDRTLPAERHAARAAVAAAHVELALVDELGHHDQRYRQPLIRVFAAAECLLRGVPAAGTPMAANTRV